MAGSGFGRGGGTILEVQKGQDHSSPPPRRARPLTRLFWRASQLAALLVVLALVGLWCATRWWSVQVECGTASRMLVAACANGGCSFVFGPQGTFQMNVPTGVRVGEWRPI